MGSTAGFRSLRQTADHAALDAALASAVAAAVGLDAAAAPGWSVAAGGPARNRCGLLLSGGIVSSAMACYCLRAGVRPLAYSLGLPDANEFAYARQVAQRLQLQLVEVTVTADALRNNFDALLRQMSTPAPDPTTFALAQLARQVRDDGLIVLSGADLLAVAVETARRAAAAQPLPPSRMATASALRIALRALHADALPPAVATRPHAGLALPPAVLLHGLQGRLLDAIATLQRRRPAEHALDLAATAELVRSYYAGERAQAWRVWEQASALLWWADVAPGQQHLQQHPQASGVSAASRAAATSPAPPPATAPLPSPPPQPPQSTTSRAEHPPDPAVGPQWAGPQRTPHHASPTAAAPTRQPLVVYTVLVGPKEALGNPLAELPEGASSDLDLDFVCITDNPALRSPVWRTVLIDGGHVPAEKLSRRPKALPHEYFADARFSLYIDNTVLFKRLPQAADLATERPSLFRAFRHATRTNPDQEAATVALLGYDDAGTVAAQMAFYAARLPLSDITPLTTATVLLREHHRPDVVRFGVLWWESILAFSKRDQLSFDFARLHGGIDVEHFDGTTRDNPLIRWHGSLSQHRIKASFDGQRYGWLHRADPAALHDPKAHFLANPAAQASGDAAYAKRGALLDYLCCTQRSSLGSHVSPRRCMADAMEWELAAHRRAGVRWVLVRLLDNPLPLAFDAAEHAAAATALSLYLAPAEGTLIELTPAEVDASRVYTSETPFDLLVLLGAGGGQLPRLLRMLQRLLAPAGGSVVAALAAPATLRQAAETEALLAERFGQPLRASLHASAHDGEREQLPNTVLALHWPAGPAQPA